MTGADVAAEFERLTTHQQVLVRQVCPDLYRAIAQLAQRFEFQERDTTAMSTAEAATLLGISKRAVRLAVQRGSLVTVGGGDDGLLFDRAHVDAYAATRRRRMVAAS